MKNGEKEKSHVGRNKTIANYIDCMRRVTPPGFITREQWSGTVQFTLLPISV